MGAERHDRRQARLLASTRERAGDLVVLGVQPSPLESEGGTDLFLARLHR